MPFNGMGGNQAGVLRCLPVDGTVNVGDSITWIGNDPHEIHTVTLYDSAGSAPGFLEPRPQKHGPPMLLRNVAPAGESEITGHESLCLGAACRRGHGRNSHGAGSCAATGLAVPYRR